uniref:Glycosyltransferase family 1 protein n=1 Tax=candidate division CPR3 bacterium TaxID=2268181 RepID=A0A7C5UST5_UNCC3
MVNMKILLVTPTYFPIIGGSEVLTRNLSIMLNEMGIHTDIMTYNGNKINNTNWKEAVQKDDFFNVFRVPAFKFFPTVLNPIAIFRMNVVPKPSFIKKIKDYDIIHFIGEADLGFPMLSYFIKKPKIMYCVGIYKNGGIYKYYMFKRPYLRNIFKRVFSNLADIYAVLSSDQVKLISDLGVPTDKVVILPHCIDIKIFQPDKKRKIDNMVLFVGRIDKIKGLHILMKALFYLKIPIQLVIIGPRWNEDYADYIEQMSHTINKRGIHKVVLFRAMDQSDLVLWYQKASIVVTPFLYETYSTVTLEALACETPVISTGEHILKEGLDGILVVPKDPKKLAKAIEKVLGDKELREKYGKCGRKLIEQQFSCESNVKKLVKLYKDILNN